MKRRKKQILSFLLVFAMIFSLNVPVYATEATSGGTSTAGESEKVITAFDKVADITLTEATEIESIDLPEKVTATIQGQSDKADISVTWSCEDYKADTNGTYIFEVVSELSGYKLDAGVTMPTVTVKVDISDAGVPSAQNNEDENSGTQNTDETVTNADNVTLSYNETTVDYPTIAAAFEDVTENANATITLNNNVDEDVTIPVGINVTLDLNGKKLTNQSDHTITNNGTLTITDSSTGENVGTVDNITHARAAVYNAENATCTILAGQFTRSQESGQSGTDNGGNSFYTINNYGLMTIGASESNGNERITVTANGHYSSLVHNGWQNSSDAVNKEATMTIHGGTFTGGINTIKNDENGILTINGGTFKNVTQYALMNWNVATINGGTFEANTNSAVYNNADVETSVGKLIITGGSFTAKSDCYIIFCDSGNESQVPSTSITGGTYSSQYYTNNNSALNYTSTPNGENGTYTVSECDVNNSVASITVENTTTYYPTLQNAIRAAKSGQTITLLDNISISASVVIDKGITIAGDSKTITDSTGKLLPAIRIETAEQVNINNLAVNNAARGVDLLNSAAQLTLNNCTFNVSERGITCSLDEYNGVTLILDGTKINNNQVSNYDTEAVYNSACRGISLWGTKHTEVTLKNNSEINGFSYCINVSGPTSESGVADTEGLVVTVDNSTLRGWTGLNVWGSLATYNIIDSTVLGINTAEGSSNNFSAIVFNDDIYDQFENSHAENNILNITDSTIRNYQDGPCIENLLRIDCGITKLNLSGNVQFIDTTGNVDYALDLTYMDDPVRFTKENLNISEGATITSTTLNNAYIPLCPTYTVYYYWDDGNGGYTGSYCGLKDVFTSANYTLCDGEYIDLIDNATLDEDVKADLQEGNGSFTLNLKGHSIEGTGRIILPEGVSVITDKKNGRWFVAADGCELEETVTTENDIITYTYSSVALVASIDDINYTSLDEAIKAVQPGETITLLKNVTQKDNTPVKIIDKGKAELPIILDLNGHTISGSNSKNGTTDSTPGGILWINGSYATLTDSSEGEKGGIINTYEGSSAAYGLVIKSTSDNVGAVTISGGVKIDVTGSTSASSRAIYFQNNTNKLGTLTLTIEDAMVTANKGHTVYASAGSGCLCMVTINGGEFNSTGKANNVSTFSGSSTTVTINGGTFHNWSTSDWNEVAKDHTICIAQTKDDAFTVTIAKQAPDDYVALVDATDVYREICLTEGSDLYVIHNIQTPAGRTIHVKKDAAYTFPEGKYYGYDASNDPGNYKLTLDLAENVTLTGGMNLYSADVIVKGAGKLAEDFTWAPADGYEMTANGEEDGLYSCRLTTGGDAELIKADGTSIVYKTVVNAIAAAKLNPGSTVKMLADYTNASQVTLGLYNDVVANFTLDLNGYTYTYSGVYDAITVNSGAKLTLTDSSEEKAGVLCTKGARDTMIANSALATTGTGGTIIIEEGVTVENLVLLDAAGSKLTVAGTINTTGFETYAISGNGSTGKGNTEIVIKDTAVITSDPAVAAPAIYHPQSGTLTIKGGTITGYGGIQMCSGDLIINGNPAITATGIDATKDKTGDGGIPDGAAISIVDRSYPGGMPSLTITGNPTVTAAEGIDAVQAYTWSDNEVSDWSEVGNYVNISGGNFSSVVQEKYCADGYVPTTEANSNGCYTVEIAKYDVVLYSALEDGQVTSVANLTGGGNDNTFGSEVTVTAGAVSGLIFKGWYIVNDISDGCIEYESETASTETTYTFEIKSDTKLVAIYETTEMVTLHVDGSDFKVNGRLQYSSYHNEFAVGTIITVDYAGSSEFSYWKNGSDKIMSKTKEYTFRIVDDTYLTPVFTQSNYAGSYVEFVSAYDQVMKAEMWYSGDSVADHALPSGPSKLGGVFKYWSLDGETEATVENIIKAVASDNSKRITVVPVYEITGVTHTVKIIYPEGECEEYSGLSEGDIKTVSAKNIAGKEFSYWSTAEQDGTILGYSPNYAVRMSRDITLYAIYDVQNVQAVPRIIMTNVFANVTDNVEKLSFETTRDVPEGYTIVETGMLYTTQSEFSTEDKMVLNGNGIKQTVSKDINSSQGTFIVNFNVTGHLDDLIFARGYVVVLNSNGSIETYYTDICSGTYNNPKD